MATVITSQGEFALNGTAIARGFPELGALWLDNEKIPGAKVSISDFIAAARALCRPR